MKKICLCGAGLFMLYALSAQPSNLDTAINPVELKLLPFKPTAKERELEKGRMNITRVTQSDDTLYYFVQGASIYSPVYVGVTSLDPSNKIDVRLHKMNWKNANRSGSTDDKGQWSEKFKTENDFGIMVIPQSKPAKYTLLVWVGDEAKIELPPVLDKDKDAASGGGKGGGMSQSTILYIVIGALAVIVAFLFFKLKNRKT